MLTSQLVFHALNNRQRLAVLDLGVFAIYRHFDTR